VKRPGYAGCLGYDVTGTVRSKTDNAGTTSITTQSSTNYAAPSQITANGFTTSMNWTSLLQLDTQTGLNGEVVNFDYNANGDLSETTTPYGLKTTHVLSTSANLLTTTTAMPDIVGQPPKPKRWTKKYMDGFGRTVKVETGYTNNGVETKLSTVDTEYEACACTPMGKVKRVSQPYPSGSPRWTVYAYDELGRVTSVTPPANSGSGAGTPTTYTYALNRVTVTEPLPPGHPARWKRYTMDAFGNLTWVHEPKPGGGEYATLYQYTPMNQLQSVTMVRNGYKNNAVGDYTQLRTFNWGTDGRLYSTTFPENGLTTYTYTVNGQLYEKFDAKGQKIRHEYDDKRRLTVVRKYPVASGSEDAGQRVTYHYDTNPFATGLNVYTTGRLAAVEYGTNVALGALRESYTYDQPGSMTLKRLGQYDVGGTLWKLEAGYTYDEEGRPKTLQYPNNGYTYTYNYDAGSRPTTMTHEETGSTVTDATVGGWNAAGLMSGLSYRFEGSDYADGYLYNNRNQLTNITIQKGVANYASFGYTYNTVNTGRVHSLARQMWNTAGTQVVNETVLYQYNTIGRLASATATTGISGQAWGQTYTYDGFGNLYNTVGSGMAAPFNLNSQSSLNSEKNQMGAHDANGNPTGLTFDVDNRLKAQGVYLFGYAADNKRVVRSKEIGGGVWEHEIAFYSGGSRLGRYRVTAPGGTWLVETIHEERYFAGKTLMPQDRLGSAAHAWLLPYGQELTNGNNPQEPNDRVKFATYTAGSERV
jgi:YD repeat-containing protein